jgi:hypothetical protein
MLLGQRGRRRTSFLSAAPFNASTSAASAWPDSSAQRHEALAATTSTPWAARQRKTGKRPDLSEHHGDV